MKTQNLDDLGDIEIEVPPDEKGFHGRECPECKGYFKIKFGTGLKGTTHCICPYCGHQADQDEFWTTDQIEFIQSYGLRILAEALDKDMKAFVQEQNRHSRRASRGLFDISIKWEYKKGQQTPIHYYEEQALETEIVCEICTLEYAIFGVFAHCPDCGTHNSAQILDANLRVVRKQIELAEQVDQPDLVEYLVNDALENIVSAFDGFGREVCKINSSKATHPAKAEHISFQNLHGAQKNIQNLFGFDLAATLQPDEWAFINRSFQKRHIVAHKMGVVDDAYVTATNDTSAVVGRKIVVTHQDVLTAIDIVKKLGEYLVRQFNAI